MVRGRKSEAHRRRSKQKTGNPQTRILPKIILIRCAKDRASVVLDTSSFCVFQISRCAEHSLQSNAVRAGPETGASAYNSNSAATYALPSGDAWTPYFFLRYTIRASLSLLGKCIAHISSNEKLKNCLSTKKKKNGIHATLLCLTAVVSGLQCIETDAEGLQCFCEVQTNTFDSVNGTQCVGEYRAFCGVKRTLCRLRN